MKLAFRLFPWHVGALNACGTFNFAAAPWKFARKLAARPTGSARHGWKIGVFRPCRFLDSGGLGLRTNAIAHFSALAPLRFVGTTHPHAHLRPTSKATAGSARTRQGTLGSLDPPSAAAPSDEPTFHLETQARAATTGAQTAPPKRGSSCVQAQPACGLCPLPPRNLRFLGSSFRCRPFGRTNVPPRNAGASRDHRGAAPSIRTSPSPETHPSAAVKRRPPARRPRRPNAAATGCGLRPLCGRGERGGGSPGRSGG